MGEYIEDFTCVKTLVNDPINTCNNTEGTQKSVIINSSNGIIYGLAAVVQCVCLYVCVCVSVCVCVCAYFLSPWRLLLSEQKINATPEFRAAMVCWRNISVSSTFVATSKTIIAETYNLATVQKSIYWNGQGHKK